MLLRAVPAIVLLTACSAPEATTLRAPGVVPGVVLAAELQPGGVRIEGSIVSEQHVDVDEGSDERWPFRVQVRDGDEVLYERTHPGPGVVDAFLGYWSEESGIDLLGSLPTLGRFPVHVPLIEGADQVWFELRDPQGSWQPAGGYDLADVESDDLGVADTVGFELLHEGGPSEQAIDVVIVGDGYTADELDLFAEHADKVVKRLLFVDAFEQFSERLNVWRVDVESAESGASYDCRDCPLRDTAFGSIFPIEVVNRLTGTTYTTRAIFQTEQWEVARAASTVPWDQVIVLVNTRKFGGMAVHYATATTGLDSYGETAVHELGHTLAGLGDEYVADYCIRSDAFGLPPNITDDPASPPWQHWIEPGTSLPTTGDGDAIGAYVGGYNCADLYRPAHDCKMNSGGAFCPVCSEQLVRHLFQSGDPVADLQVEGTELRVSGAAPGTVIRWLVDGEVLGEEPAADVIELGRLRGDELAIEAEVQSDLVRAHDGELLQRWTWSLE